MPQLLLEGGKPLTGCVRIDAAKNAVLPALAATLLTDETVRLRGVPELRDVQITLDLIKTLGKRIDIVGTDVAVQGSGTLHAEAEHRYVQQMRASFLVLGPLLARLGRAIVPLPGGCTIGPRPIDLHLEGLRRLGARVRQHDGAVELTADRLRGARIQLRYPSVGATEQLLMAATLARGETIIDGGAQEPEVQDLAALLRAMGAQIASEDGTFTVHGVDRLAGTEHIAIPDRIEASTYLLAAGATRGDVIVTGIEPTHMTAVFSALRSVGGHLSVSDGQASVHFDRRPKPLHCVAGPYPAFPTDLQPPLVACLSLAEGASTVIDPVFPDRYGYVPQLRRFGAAIETDRGEARIRGVPALRGASVVAPDLRGGAALVLAGLAASGRSDLSAVEILDRGYAQLTSKLAGLGAQIERVDAS